MPGEKQSNRILKESRFIPREKFQILKFDDNFMSGKKNDR